MATTVKTAAANQKAPHPARLQWWPRVVRGSIATRLVAFSIVLVTLTATVIGSLAYVRARQALEREARIRLTLSARSVAERFRSELVDRVADTMNWSHLEIMRAVLFEDVDKQLAQFLHQIVQGRPFYLGIVCLDSAGRQVAAAGQTSAAVLEGSPHGSRISIVSLGDRAERSLRIDAPLVSPDDPNLSIGMLVVFIDPRYLLNTGGTLARTAGAQVHLMLRSRSGEVLVQTLDGSLDRPSSVAVDSEGVLTGAASVNRLADMDGPELQVVVAESSDAALGAIATLPRTLIRIATFALLLSALVGAVVAWRITRPIRRLTETVRQINERGDVDPTIEFEPMGGEVGVLAAAFRATMDNLAAAQTEALVQSRRAFLGEIAANVAHEVRTPLSVLKTSAQLMMRPEAPMDAADRLRLAATIVAEVDRLNRVVTDLVDLARPKAVHYQLEAIGPIISRAVTFFRPLAARAAVQVVETVENGSARVSSSADQLYQVLLNLLQNAIQAMNGPGVVSVRCTEAEGWIVVDVEDTGPGVARDVLPRLFSPFCTTKSNGAGLGLAISKRIVEEHGGSITAENLTAGGARFRMRLPSKGAE